MFPFPLYLRANVKTPLSTYVVLVYLPLGQLNCFLPLFSTRVKSPSILHDYHDGRESDIV